MGFFDQGKMSKESGEWAATAMGCMVFADGSASESEIAAVKAQVEANPVVTTTIGSHRALEIFGATIEAIRPIPLTMLATYEVKLAGLAEDIDSTDDRNFALSTVVAVAMGDGTLTDSEYAMMARFREMLSATIPIPQPGQADPARVQASEPEQATATSPSEPLCATCSQVTSFYPGYGHWCASCKAYAQASSSSATPASAVPAASAEPANPFCGHCGKVTQFYAGYGHWCAPCQKYTTS